MADWGTAAGLRQDQTARKEQGWGISSCLLPPFPCSAGAICFSLRFFPFKKKGFSTLTLVKLHNCPGPVQPTGKLNKCSALESKSNVSYSIQLFENVSLSMITTLFQFDQKYENNYIDRLRLMLVNKKICY